MSASEDQLSIADGASRSWIRIAYGSRTTAIGIALAVALEWWCLQASGALLPFPLLAGQRGYVSCLERTMTNSVVYDVYLPPAYSTNGPALPIVYTFNPGGGGMVS